MGQATSAIRRVLAGLATATVFLGVVVGAGVAQAADTDYLFFGAASGAQIQPTPGGSTSWEVGATGLLGGPLGRSSSGPTQGGSQGGVIKVGAVATRVQITRITGGWEVVSTAKAGNVSLLSGAVTATSVTTRTALSEVAGKLATDITTTFANLHVAGTTLPQKIPENYVVKVGNLASIELNAKYSFVEPGTADAIGAGIRMTLLKPVGKYPAGTEVSVSPALGNISPSSAPPSGHTNLGQSYGSKVTAPKGRTLVGIRSDPTAPVTVYVGGTDGKTLTNALAAVRLGNGLQLGSVADTGFGTNETSGATTITTSKVAAVNLFSGLIKANSLTAHASASSNGNISGTVQLNNLVIAGHVINLNASPNTIINVLNLGRITVNQQIRTAHGITVRALVILMKKAQNGLPVGAQIQIGVAQASAT